MTAAEILARLIALNSVSKNSNIPIADEICSLLDRPGVRIERDLNQAGDKCNLLIQIGPETSAEREGLVLSGHMDVVPADEPEWRSDPFEMVETNDSFVGRGTADMKGFIALAIAAARDLPPDQLKRPLVLLLTRDEEVGTAGAKHFVDHYKGRVKLPRKTIIGEPTSLRAVRLHKGHTQCRIRFHGKSAHSGYPHLGENAIGHAGVAIEALGQLARTMQSERNDYSNAFAEVPFVPLNLGTIHGGAAVNVVADACELKIGFRALPGMRGEQIAQRVSDTLSKALPASAFSFELINDSPPFALAEDAAIYQHVCGLTGQKETHAVNFATDAGWLQSLDLDCTIFGPGSIEVAHRPNESMPKQQFAEGAALLARSIAAFVTDPA